jgi:SPP1 gp7 family putative phage head morphogenesis protein
MYEAVSGYVKHLEKQTLARYEAAKALKATLPSPESVLFSPGEAGNTLWSIVKQYGLESVWAGAQRAAGDAGKADGFTFDPLNPRVIEHLHTKELLVKTIPGEWHDKLRKELEAGMAKGEGVAELQRRVSLVYENLSGYQSRRIAQTETVGALNVGVMAGYEEAGVEWHMWIATLDDRVRDEHAERHGMVVKVGEEFAPDVLYPGDGPAHEAINCFVDPKVPIFTDRGWVGIGKIEVGDKVLTHLGRFRPVTAVSHAPKYLGPVVRIDFEVSAHLARSLKAITVTPNHRVLTERGWIEARSVMVGDNLVAVGLPCPECGQVSYMWHASEYCSKPCRDVKMGREHQANLPYRERMSKKATAQWNDPAHRKNMSEKTSAQLAREYENGTRDPDRIVRKARKACFEKYGDGGYFRVAQDVIRPLAEKAIIEKYGSRYEMLRQTAFPALGRSGHGGSKLNKSMARFLAKWNTEVIPEFEIGRKRVDFYLPEHKLFIECDGAYFHQDAEADRLRDIGILRLYPDHQIARVRYTTGKPVWEYRSLETLNHEGAYGQCLIPVTAVALVQHRMGHTRYNLAVEEDESYIAKGIAVHNCRCTTVMAEAPADQQAAGTGGDLRSWGTDFSFDDMRASMELTRSFSDQDNVRQGMDTTKGLIQNELFGRLKGNQEWRDYAVRMQTRHSADEAFRAARNEVDFRAAWSAQMRGRVGTEAQFDEFIDSHLLNTVRGDITKWAGTSGDTDADAVVMQIAAQREFSLGQATLEHFTSGVVKEAESRLVEDEAGVRAFLRAQYEYTQEKLTAAGVDQVVLYRGAFFDTGTQVGDAVQGLVGEGRRGTGLMPAGLQPISSFSGDPWVSWKFSGALTRSGVKSVVAARVPREAIFSTCQSGFGCKAEAEFVVLGQDVQVKARIAGSGITLTEPGEADAIRTMLISVIGGL